MYGLIRAPALRSGVVGGWSSQIEEKEKTRSEVKSPATAQSLLLLFGEDGIKIKIEAFLFYFLVLGEASLCIIETRTRKTTQRKSYVFVIVALPIHCEGECVI